jgi:hypothetical protein
MAKLAKVAKLAKDPATKAPKKTPRKKSKYITELCSHCGKVAKMELLGVAMGNEGSMQWGRCTKCRHMMVIGTAATDSSSQPLFPHIAVEDCLEYSVKRSFSIGDAIYHTEWQDIGTVLSKEITAAGHQAVVVHFEKMGERRLLENFSAELAD